MRGFAIGAAVVSCVAAISTYGCGGTTIDSGGTGTSSNGGSAATGGASAGGTKNTGGSGGQLGGGGSMGSSSGGATGFGGVGGVSGFTGFGGASGFGGVGGTGGLSCTPPTCAGCGDCFSSCYCQTQNMNGCITKCSGGTGGTGGSGVGGSSFGGVGGTSFGGVGGSGGTVDCNALINDVYAKLDAAKTCCPFCNSLQCTASVDGPCCPETVNTADSAETQAYLAALKLLRSQPSCGIACPAIACGPAQPSYNCVADASGAGRCQ